MLTETLINRYKVLERLGEGAMGAVWLVEDATSQTILAMKVLSGQTEGTEKSYLQLKQEFRLMTQLRHPNCCAVYDYGQLPEGAPFLTMEVVPGQGLDEMLPLSADRFKPILSQLLLALGYVHQLGYVHGDIKSANVRVKPDGVLKLMDFGLMELSGRSGAPIKGTLGYLAPEVVKRGPIDLRTDLYAVGCLAYELLSGRLPFVSTKAMDVLRAHVTDTPQPITQLVPELDPAIARIVHKLLAKDPLDRYPSAYEALADLGVAAPDGIGGNLLTSPMVGREAALGALQEQLVSIAKWQPGGAVLLTGPAGIGKTRLVEEFRYLVQVENLAYAKGGLTGVGITPYGPIVEVLRKLLPVLREQVEMQLTALAPVLVKLLPELASLGLPSFTAAPELDPPMREKLRLQATVSDLLVELATRVPIVIALEDWHWADPLSGELLEYLLRNTREASILFVITSRPVPEAVASWGDRVFHVPVGGLDVRGTWRMVTSMLGLPEVGQRFLQQVAEFSAGSPLMIERLLEHLVREKVLVSTRARWETHIELDPAQLPTDMGALWLAKLEDLSQDAKDLARAAAVIGQGVTLDLLQNVTALSDDALFDAIKELTSESVLESDEREGYRFSAEQLAPLVYDLLPLAARTKLHAAVVGALEHRIWGKELGELSFEDVRGLAFHSLKGNVPEKTIVYALETGVRSLALNANATAEQYLSDGLALVRLAPLARWKRQLLDYLFNLATVYRVTSKHAAAKELLEEAIPLAEELGRLQMLGHILASLAKSCQLLTDYDASIAHAERAIEVSSSVDDQVGTARALMTLGRVRFFKGELAEALACGAKAVAAGRASGDRTILAGAFGMGGYFAVASGKPDRLEEGIRELNQSLALLEEAGDKLGLINSLSFLGNAQVMLGEFLGAWTTFGRMRSLSYELGAKDDEIVALVNLATTALELGNARESAERAREARTLVEKRGSSKYARGVALVVEAVASLYAGAPAKSAAMAQEAVDFTREIKNKYVEALALPYQIEVLLQLGRLEEARTVAESLDALILETGNTEPEVRLRLLQAELLGRTGRLKEARAIALAAYEHSVGSQSKGMQVRAGRVIAWLELKAEAWDEAWDRATTALALAGRIGAKIQAQELDGILGELALASLRSPVDGEGHFRAMEVAARQTDVKQALALALFGQAACRPAASESARLVEEAQGELMALAASLDEQGSLAFLLLGERSRVMGGDRFAASLPRRLADRGEALWLKLRMFYSSVR